MNDDFENMLTKEQSNQNVGIIQFFVTSIDNFAKIIFVEGDDDITFYYDFASAYLGNSNLHFFGCGGKRGVINAQNFFRSYNNDKNHSMYFLCDKDFQPFTGNFVEGIYYTPCYSIEGFFFDTKYVSYILSKHGQNTIKSSEIKKIINIIDVELSRCVRKLRAPMALACALRIKKNEFDFDKIDTTLLFNFVNGGLSPKKGRFSSLVNTLKINTQNINWSDVHSIAKLFTEKNCTVWIRGKLAIQILKLVVSNAIENVLGKSKIKQKILNYFGSIALTYGKNFIGDIDSLKHYFLKA